MNLLLASASRPIASCWAARALHTPHQSFHDATPAVTSSKSVSATPFATKRGAQWAIADLTSASIQDSVLILSWRRSGPRRMAASGSARRRPSRLAKRRAPQDEGYQALAPQGQG